MESDRGKPLAGKSTLNRPGAESVGGTGGGIQEDRGRPGGDGRAAAGGVPGSASGAPGGGDPRRGRHGRSAAWEAGGKAGQLHLTPTPQLTPQRPEPPIRSSTAAIHSQPARPTCSLTTFAQASPWSARIEPDECPEWQLGTVPLSGDQGASESANLLLPALWLSRPPEPLSALR